MAAAPAGVVAQAAVKDVLHAPEHFYTWQLGAQAVGMTTLSVWLQANGKRIDRYRFIIGGTIVAALSFSLLSVATSSAH